MIENIIDQSKEYVDSRLFDQVYYRRDKKDLIPYEEPNPSPSTSMDKPSLEKGRIKSGEMELVDMDLPIAVRKETHAYTQNSIERYVSYSKLNENYKCFTSL